ncbi:MAG: hypothetical protein AB7F43_08225 [Bacteriovoracia bacterium]
MGTKKSLPFANIFLISVLPLLATVGLAYLLGHTIEERTLQISRMFSEEKANSELTRLTAMLNFRLNQIREDFAGLFYQQTSVVHALKEAEREKLVFYRRPYLADFATLIERDVWEVQKNYVRDKKLDSQEIGKLFKEGAKSIRESGLWLRKINLLDFISKTSGVSPTIPSTIGWTSSDAYAIGLLSQDETHQAFFGIVQSGYIFPFCKYFSEGSAFILDEQGTAICHSQTRLEGTRFNDYSLFPAVMGASGPTVRYLNINGQNVVAAVKKINQNQMILVAESVFPENIRQAVREIFDLRVEDLRKLMIPGIAGLVVFLLTFFVLYFMLSKAFKKNRVVQETSVQKDGPNIDSLGVDLNEYGKLKNEIKDLERTVLDLQSSQAFLSGIQKILSESRVSSLAELVEQSISYLNRWNLSCAYYELTNDSEGRTVLNQLAPEKSTLPSKEKTIVIPDSKNVLELTEDKVWLKEAGSLFEKDEVQACRIEYQDRAFGILFYVYNQDDFSKIQDAFKQALDLLGWTVHLEMQKGHLA